MDLQLLDIIFKGITLLVVLSNTAATVWLFVQRRRDVRAKAMEVRQDGFDEKLAKQGAKLGSEVAERKEESSQVKQRLALAEQAIRTMPTHQDLQRIGDRLGVLERDVGSIDTRTEGIQETVNTIRDHLLERKI